MNATETGGARRPVVLVTGAAGVIGGAVLRHLADRYALRPLDRRAPGPGWIEADITDPGAVRRACDGAWAVVHLAAASAVESPWEDVLSANIVGAATVFEAACAAGVSRVVFASSNHVVGGHELDWAPSLYDAADSRTVGIDAELRPDSLYGVSKVFGEALGRYHHDRHGLGVVCLRIGSVLADDDPWRAAGRLTVMPEERLALFRRLRTTWLSQADAAGLIGAALDAPVGWAVVYGVSANRRHFWDLEPARILLGWEPRDAAPEQAPTTDS